MVWRVEKPRFCLLRSGISLDTGKSGHRKGTVSVVSERSLVSEHKMNGLERMFLTEKVRMRTQTMSNLWPVILDP